MVRKNLDQRLDAAETRPDDVLAQSGLTGAALVTAGDLVWQAGDIDAPFVIYSLTKPVICAALLSLAAEGAIDLDAALVGRRLAGVSMRQLMRHTAGVRDYGQLPEYHQAVRRSPSEPWSDEEFLRRALGDSAAPDPGLGWAYSNTGYLLLRQIPDGSSGRATGSA